MASAASPHVPAWKKLGLKLKYAKEEAPQDISTRGTNGTTQVKSNDSSSKEPPRKKRRFSDSDEPPSSTSPKTHRSLKESEDTKLKKKVSFTTDTKTKDDHTARPANPPILLPYTNGTINSDTPTAPSPSSQQDKQPKPKAKSKSKQPQPSTTKPKAGLSYLTTFYTIHSTWKFSKNHSTWLLKNALSETAIPRSYNFPLACYLHNLQSTAARERLKSQCEKARLADDDSGKEHIDDRRIADFLSAVKAFTANPEGFEEIPAVASWAEEQKRTDIIWWVLQPDGLHDAFTAEQTREVEAVLGIGKGRPVPDISASDMDEVPPKRRNRKSRTSITAADISSSSSSSSSSSESDGGDSKNDGTDEDETASSGSDSD